MSRSSPTPRKAALKRRPGRPSATEPSGDRLREVVIEAAMRVYAEHGYQRSSVELMLQAADISRPTFYRLFADKREVIHEALGRAYLDLVTALPAAVISARSLEEGINLALDAYFDWARRHVPGVGAFYREIHDRDSPASELREQALTTFLEVVRARAADLGFPGLDPIFIEALLHVAEYVGGNCFASGNPSEEQILRARQVAGRIILAAVLSGIDNKAVPPLIDFFV